MNLLRKTYSVCPTCLKKITAELKSDGYNVFIEKTCAEHGFFSTLAWRGEPSIIQWAGNPIQEEIEGKCPEACGLCSEHKQGSCCLLLEVSNNCQLSCPHCFADSPKKKTRPDPRLEEVKTWVSDIAATGQAFLQLSGGEPTLRDDLPEIVRHAKEAGCAYVQVNSNAIRLAEDENYVLRLAEAGLSFVFMQFDGTSDEIYQKLRQRSFLQTKIKAIEHCGRYNIGVCLVPTVVPGVNDHDLGNIIKFAVGLSPIVRGVHFQPISYFGASNAPLDAARISLPEVLNAVYQQASELVPPQSLAASCCDHPRCGFHGAYIVMPDGALKAYTKAQEASCCPTSPAPAESNRHFIGLRWQRSPEKTGGQAQRPEGALHSHNNLDSLASSQPESEFIASSSFSIPMVPKKKLNDDISTLDGFLSRAKSHSFTISAMAFQDAYNLDLERLRQCSLHVYDKGDIVPFCAYYNLRQGRANN